MSRRLPPLNALRAFEAAARHLSFTLAADELHVTQAAVSHQIKGLEEWLEIPLFHRRNRSLALTEAGASYLPRLSAALDTIAEATERLTRVSSPRTLTVSCLPSFASKWLLPRLTRFQASHPNLDVLLETTPNVTDFTRQEVDIAIRMGSGRWPGVKVELLMTEVLFPVCSPALLTGPKPLREPADLAHHTLIHDDFAIGWENWSHAAGLSGIDFRRGPRFTDSALMVQAAIGGRGVCLARDALVRDDLAAGRLVRPFSTQVPGLEAYYVVAPSHHFDRPKVKAFRDWLFAEVKRMEVDETSIMDSAEY